jgi:hypothetical protein
MPAEPDAHEHEGFSDEERILACRMSYQAVAVRIADHHNLIAWAQLPLASRRAILDVVADVHVLPVKPTTRGFDPDGVRIDWKVA